MARHFDRIDDCLDDLTIRIGPVYVLTKSKSSSRF